MNTCNKLSLPSPISPFNRNELSLKKIMSPMSQLLTRITTSANKAELHYMDLSKKQEGFEG